MGITDYIPELIDPTMNMVDDSPTVLPNHHITTEYEMEEVREIQALPYDQRIEASELIQEELTTGMTDIFMSAFHLEWLEKPVNFFIMHTVTGLKVLGFSSLAIVVIIFLFVVVGGGGIAFEEITNPNFNSQVLGGF